MEKVYIFETRTGLCHDETADTHLIVIHDTVVILPKMSIVTDYRPKDALEIRNFIETAPAYRSPSEPLEHLRLSAQEANTGEANTGEANTGEANRVWL
jgi:hypothetical protein